MHPRAVLTAVVLASWAIAVACILAAAHCAPSRPNTSGTVYQVAVECPEPQRDWIVLELETLGAVGRGWRLADGTDPDVTVVCGDTGDRGGAEEYVRGTDLVVVDPTKAPGEFAARAAAGHGLVHWLVDHGPHSDRAVYHVCWYPVNVPAPPGCHADFVARDALMAPSLGTGGGIDTWSSREVYTGPLAQYVPTDADLRLIAWGLGE